MNNNNIWYLIIDKKHNNAAYNMAVDEFMLTKSEEIKNTTFLRFYGWNPPSISIGRSQRHKRVANLSLLKQHGIDFVRRPTGGKTVLHFDELTYSIASSDNTFMSTTSIREVYNLLAQALLKGLQNLKINAKIISKDPKGIVKTDLPCFSYPTRDEIVINGKKIIGSAQKRSKSAFLQHGSIPVKDRRELYAEITEVDKSVLIDSMTTIEIEVGNIDFTQIRDSFIKGFKDEFKINYKEYVFDKEDIDKINSLINNKYSSVDWNYEL